MKQKNNYIIFILNTEKNNNNFITNGRPVIRFHTIAENNIKDGQVVQIIPVD